MGDFVIKRNYADSSTGHIPNECTQPKASNFLVVPIIKRKKKYIKKKENIYFKIFRDIINVICRNKMH